ncbi:hypothetical protein PN462_14045 [Spirulina sp. CS-785/01]|uniref:hypothetical protein n=1 Tax=Spirulina sp. CS-785/01 TaxID=3021716 RepID=UPI00232E91AF|nr:hypothetical protein [Spirulina sp. CS-785/01]MDB9314230.1 hypothetical protein [Spirulina sp. CS-785/01]
MTAPVSPPPKPLLQPLNAGNIVTITVNLYLTHFRTYVGVAWQGILWIVLPILGITALSAILATTSAGILLLFGLSAGVALIYCFAQFLTHSALISRLAFNHLLDSDETVKEAKTKVKKRVWSFLGLAVFLAIFMMITYIVSFVIFFIFIGIGSTMLAGLGGIANPSNTAVGVLVSIFILLLVITFFVLFSLLLLWIYCRFFVLEVPLAVETQLKVYEVIQINWNLSKKNTRYLMVILSIAFLVNAPIYLVFQLLSIMVQTLAELIIDTPFPSVVVLVLSYLLGYLVSIVGGLLLIPFWQTLKGVIFYDLKTRREGFDLQLKPIQDS